MNDDEPAIQVFWRRGKLVLRSAPSTPPTQAQLLARRAFAEAAKKASGMSMNGNLPPAAIEVASMMLNRTFGGTERPPKWKLLLFDFLVRKGYSKEEATAIIKASQK